MTYPYPPLPAKMPPDLASNPLSRPSPATGGPRERERERELEMLPAPPDAFEGEEVRARHTNAEGGVESSDDRRVLGAERKVQRVSRRVADGVSGFCETPALPPHSPVPHQGQARI